MDSGYIFWLSLVVFLPAIGALAITIFPRDATEWIKIFTLIITAAVFVITVAMALGWVEASFAAGQAEMQNLFSVPWIKSFDIFYMMGIDGISFPLILLTSFVTVLAMGASWSITKNVKAYCVLFLLLETGMLGVFMALDFFLFYVFWEVMLLPMYFLIGVWGGPRKEYAAIKFFLYTLVGSVLILIAILMLYFKSDLRELDTQQLYAAGVLDPYISDDVPTAEAAHAMLLAEIKAQNQGGNEVENEETTPTRSEHTFNILALQQMGQKTDLFSGELLWGQSLQWWAFLLLLIGFLIKVPSVPLHTWLPDAHVEAPTPISMILAGILLKMGGYGIIRICYPICPEAGYQLAYFVCLIGVVSMVYGAFAALAQTDFKRLVAYSSVSHMGYVVLGLGVWTAVSGLKYDPEYWQMGMNGAMFQMIAHGISSAGMFFMVGVVYERVHHRNLNEFGGLFAKMPVYSGMSIFIFFAGLGLPGLCGFIGEVFVTLSVWNYSKAMAIIAASVVVLTAGYILWTIQRVYLGPEYKGPHGDALTRMNLREMAIAVPLIVAAIVFGVFPQSVFNYMTPSVNQLVVDLKDWTENHDKTEAEVHQASRQQPDSSVVQVGTETNEPRLARTASSE